MEPEPRRPAPTRPKTEAEPPASSQDEVVRSASALHRRGEPGLLYRNVPARRLKLANGEEAW